MADEKWLKEALDKLEGKVDKLDQRLDDTYILHVKNTAVLEEHQRRSEANEKNIEMLRVDFKPIQKDVIMVSGVFKALGIVSVVMSVVGGIIKVLDFFK